MREDLLDTASRRLGELGDVELLSLRGLAAEIGISAPSIYRHFPDKATLLIAVAEREFAKFGEELKAASATGGEDPFNRLRGAGHAYLRLGEERPAHYRILFGGVGLPCARDQSEPRLPAGRPAFEALVELVAACLETGPGGDGLDAFAVSTELWALMHGLVDLPFGNSTFPWGDVQRFVDAWLERFRAWVLLSPG